MSGANGGNGQAPTTPTNADSGNGQAPTTPQNNSGSPSSAPNGQAPTANNDNYTAPSADEYRRMRQELDEARRDAGKYRDELKKRDDANLTDQQRRDREFTELQTKSTEVEQQLQRLHLENAGLRLAPSLGIADPSAALALVQAEHSSEIKFGSDGRPENLSDLFKQVLKDHPVLAAQSQGQQPRTAPASSGGASNPGRQAGNGGLTLDMIKAMPMRERINRMDEIRAWEKAQQQN